MTSLLYDVDQHVCDLKLEEFEFDLPKSLKADAPRNQVIDGVERLVIEDRAFPKPEGKGVGSPMGSLAGGEWLSTEQRLSWMSERGIDKAILIPGNLGLACDAIQDHRLKKSVCEAYRKWQCADVASYEGQCTSAILADPYSLPSDDILALDSVSALLVKPTNSQGKHLWEPEMMAIFELAHRHDLAIVVHGGTGYYQMSPVADCYDNYFFSHLFSHHVETQIFLSELFISNALVKYPRARIVFVESGVSWVPSFVKKMAFHLEKMGAPLGYEPTDVYERFSEQCLFAAFMDNLQQLEETAEQHDWLNVCVGTDFPHWDTFDIKNFSKIPLKTEFRQSISRGQAERFFESF